MNGADVAVIGAGVFGSWSAWHLARAGLKVTLIDAYGAGNSRASSGGESRIIRMGYGCDEIYTRSSQRSLAYWLEFAARSKQPLFYRTGVLWTARSDDVYATDTQRTLRRCGAPFELLDGGDLARVYPQMHCPEGSVGILEPDSGALMARRAVQALTAEILEMGAEYVPDRVRMPVGDGRLTAVTTGGSRAISADTFVFACGPWLPKIFPALLGQRIFPTRQEIFFFGTPAGDRRFTSPALPIWTYFSDEAHPYGFPDLENRGMKIALDRHGAAIDPDTAERIPGQGAVAEARRHLAQRFPALAEAPLLEARVCQYENTSNGDFLIDRHPDFTNVWLAGGGSGHGFKHGPAVGEYLAGRILKKAGEEPRYSLASKAEVQRRTVF